MAQKRSSKQDNFPVLREQILPPHLAAWAAAGRLEPNIRAYRMGKLRIMVGTSESDGWHMSISHPARYPTWDEIAHVRYRLIPGDIEMVMHLPPEAEYVNVHDNCFHLYELREAKRESGNT
jgi:hypothetical protein